MNARAPLEMCPRNPSRGFSRIGKRPLPTMAHGEGWGGRLAIHWFGSASPVHTLVFNRSMRCHS